GEARESGAWEHVHPFEPPFLRYDNPLRARETVRTYTIEVRSPDGTRFGRSAPLASARGIYPETVLVHADESRASVRGRVVDTSGAPMRKAVVTVASLDRPGEPSAWPAVETRDDGAFEFQGLVCGAYRVCARPRRGELPASLRVDLAPGVVLLPDLVVSAQQP